MHLLDVAQHISPATRVGVILRLICCNTSGFTQTLAKRTGKLRHIIGGYKGINKRTNLRGQAPLCYVTAPNTCTYATYVHACYFENYIYML